MDDKKFIKFLKDLKIIISHLDGDIETVYIMRKGIYLIGSRLSLIKHPLLNDIPYSMEFNFLEFYEFIKTKKMSDFIEINEHTNNIDIIFESELSKVIENEKPDIFRLKRILEYPNKNKRYKILKRFNNIFETLECTEDEVLKDVLTNSPFPYNYNGFMIMKSVAPVFNKSSKISWIDLNKYNQQIFKTDKWNSGCIKITKSKFNIYVLINAKKNLNLKFASKKRW